MSAKARITAEFATPSDVASRLRIPASRAAELRLMVIDFESQRPGGSIASIRTKASRPQKAVKTAATGRAARAKKK
jgi:hypothetical protein